MQILDAPQRPRHQLDYYCSLCRYVVLGTDVGLQPYNMMMICKDDNHETLASLYRFEVYEE